MNQCWKGQRCDWVGGCAVPSFLREKKSSVELRDRTGVEAIGSVLKRNRLRVIMWKGKIRRIG